MTRVKFSMIKDLNGETRTRPLWDVMTLNTCRGESGNLGWGYLVFFSLLENTLQWCRLFLSNTCRLCFSLFWSKLLLCSDNFFLLINLLKDINFRNGVCKMSNSSYFQLINFRSAFFLFDTTGNLISFYYGLLVGPKSNLENTLSKSKGYSDSLLPLIIFTRHFEGRFTS